MKGITINKPRRLDDILLDFAKDVVDFLLGADKDLQGRRVGNVVQSPCVGVGQRIGGGRFHVVVRGRSAVVSVHQ